jgi:hypothetical protein
VAGSCEQGNEYSISIKDEELLEYSTDLIYVKCAEYNLNDFALIAVFVITGL